MINYISYFFLSLGLVFTTATQFRLTGLPLGLGELCILLALIINLSLILSNSRFYLKKKDLLLSILITLFFLSLFIGWTNGIFLNNNQDSFHDVIAYIFSLGIIFSLILSNNFSFEYILKYYFWIVIISQTFFFSLFLIGIDFVAYGNRFTSWSENPNQLALLLVVTPFIGLYLFNQLYSKYSKLLYGASILIAIILGIATRSDALIFSWIVIGSFLGMLVVLRMKHRLFMWYSKITILMVSITIISINIPLVLKKVNSMYSEGNQGNVRIELWRTALKNLGDSYLLGYGPGAFSSTEGFEVMESHNVYIDLATNFGIIGLLILIFITIYSCIMAYKNKQYFIICIIVSVILFGIFHHLGRQPIFWVMITSGYFVMNREMMNLDNQNKLLKFRRVQNVRDSRI